MIYMHPRIWNDPGARETSGNPGGDRQIAKLIISQPEHGRPDCMQAWNHTATQTAARGDLNRASYNSWFLRAILPASALSHENEGGQSKNHNLANEWQYICAFAIGGENTVSNG